MRIATALGALLLVAGPISALRAQGADLDKVFEDKVAGYRLKPPKGWMIVPLTPDKREAGLALQMDAPDKGPVGGHLRVLALESERKLDDWIEGVIEAENHEDLEGFAADAPEVDESVQVGALTAHHRQWHANLFVIDAWYYDRKGDPLAVIYTVSDADKFARSWLSAFTRSAKSVETFAPTAAGGKGAAAITYADQLAAASAEAARTPGWHVVPTPSEKFILTTSCDNVKFVDEVIDRLERSRTVFEEDYPPPPDFRHVSIVRLCKNEEEFHRYGDTGGGVAGWFNPATTELVLYDAQDVDRNMSYAVMTHEAFHQYCHFLFGRSEAHRWFDEGHGDYYGGMKFTARGKPRITAQMPGGLERLTGIRELIQMGTYKPLPVHLNYDHPSWQGQGPTNVSPYEQSWSIVFMLRQGMLGNVNSKVWRPEYANILPAYIETLRKGFEEAYAEELAKRAAAHPEEAGATSDEQIELDSSDLDPKRVQAIWKAAMDASWGKVDLKQFEEDWKLYVKKFLKD